MKIFAKIRFYWGAFVIAFIVAFLMIPLVTLLPNYKSILLHRLNRMILFLLGGIKAYSCTASTE